MVDFHTHILPHIDDGAKDTATAIAMLESEYKQGVTDVLLTSHYYGKRHGPERFVQKRDEIWAYLKPNAPEGLNVHLAAEVHFTGLEIIDYEALCELAIEGTKYILIEFPFLEKWPRGILDKLADFIYETGYTPIIAHVERYREVLKRPNYATKLVNMGCLLQINTSAFRVKREKKFVLSLLERNMVHCIGTDTHDMGFRKPNMQAAKTEMEEAGFGARWNEIQDRMHAILRGEKVEVQAATPIKNFFGKYI